MILNDNLDKIFIWDFIKNNRNIFVKYFLLCLIIYPLQNIGISKIVNKIFYDINDQNKLLINLKYLLIILSVVIVFNNLKFKTESNIINEYNTYLRNIIFTKTLDSLKTDFKEISTTRYVTAINDVIESVRFFIMDVLRVFIPIVFVLLVCVLYIFYQSKRLGLVCLTGLLIIFYYSSLIISKIIYENERREFLKIKINENINNKFNNIDNILLNDKTEDEIKYNENLGTEYHKITEKCFNYISKMKFYMATLFIIFVSITLFLNYKLNWKENKKLFSLILLILLVLNNSLILYIEKVPEFSLKLSEYLIDKKYFKELISDKNLKVSKEKFTKDIYQMSEKPQISFEKVSFGYNPTHNLMFKDLNLVFPSGTCTAIIGGSGKGKTTLVKLLLKFYKIQKGKITIDGIDIENINSDIIRKNIIYLNQRTHLLEGTVLENIQYGNKDISEEEIVSLIKKYKLESTLLPILHQNVGLKGDRVSLGIQKLIILIRTLLKKDIKVLILDEPLTSLDENNVTKVIEMIKDFILNKTTIIITHDDRILNICQNKIDIKDITQLK